MDRRALISRVLALSLLCLPIGLVAWLISLYTSHYAMRSEAIATQRQLLGRLEAFIAAEDEIESRIEARRADNLEGLFVTAASPSLAMAQLQQILQPIISKQQAQFLRATELPPLEREGLGFTGLRLELAGTIESLVNVVEAIESTVPLLFISRAVFAADPASLRDPHYRPTLALTLEISAALLRAFEASSSEEKG